MAINLRKPLDITKADGVSFLKGLQGNILKSHGRDNAMHLFISFGQPTSVTAHKKSMKEIRNWMGNMLNNHITNAHEQFQDKTKSKTFQMLLLSSFGYEYLGEPRPRDGAFRDGLRDRRQKLNDPVFQKWDPNYKVDEDDIHALIIVASKSPAELNKKKNIIESELIAIGGSILIDQRGKQKRENGHAVEHFGYVDGVSQPNFFDDGKPGAKNFDQKSPLKLVLEKDRNGEDGYGSYFVYRLLEQNVDSFDDAVNRIANEVGISEELAGAMAVGRFKNGTPLTTNSKTKIKYDPSKDEDFNYDKDEDGNKCPFHSHIRKVNPRDSLGFIKNILGREQDRRIARRGITYTNNANNTVGLIFMCFQSDIKDQFEFIQKSWANNHSFSERGTGLDPVIGQDGGPQELNDFPNWPTGYDKRGRKRIKFDEHVKFLGGEYFFAPSISGLEEISGI